MKKLCLICFIFTLGMTAVAVVMITADVFQKHTQTKNIITDIEKCTADRPKNV